ncbi:hypothetical protein [Noviherbaspirillum denitrificans]|uniref:hypothetical protein n=1 Tax=Noviherbaspirillum denitrificans TaxID=1968433 RepID=UPI000B52CF8E|nr:hypothetical protein [Noviherbaspirillum denitrificans]
METTIIPPIKKAAEVLGVPVLASICSVSPVAVYKWLKKGRLPRTEWTGETNYAALIAEASKGTEFECTREQLLQLPAAVVNCPEQVPA